MVTALGAWPELSFESHQDVSGTRSGSYNATHSHSSRYQHLSAEVQAEAAKHIIEEVFPLRLTQFERLLEQSPTNWIAGTQGPSIADFVLGTFSDCLLLGKACFSRSLHERSRMLATSSVSCIAFD